MEIEGAYTFSAPLELVWMVLLDPVSIQQSMPGCESFDQESVHEYSAVMQIKAGPFKDMYTGTIQLDQVVPYHGFDLAVAGQSAQGPITGNGHLHLEEKDGATTLYYAGNIEVNNPVALESPRLVRTTANALIRQYLEGIAQQIRLQTQIYTTEIDSPQENSIRRDIPVRTVSMQDWVEKARRDRRTTIAVLLLFLLSSLMLFGAFRLFWVVFRWGVRYFARHVATIVQEDQIAAEIPHS